MSIKATAYLPRFHQEVDNRCTLLNKNRNDVESEVTNDVTTAYQVLLGHPDAKLAKFSAIAQDQIKFAIATGNLPIKDAVVSVFKEIDLFQQEVYNRYSLLGGDLKEVTEQVSSDLGKAAQVMLDKPEAKLKDFSPIAQDQIKFTIATENVPLKDAVIRVFKDLGLYQRIEEETNRDLCRIEEEKQKIREKFKQDLAQIGTPQPETKEKSPDDLFLDFYRGDALNGNGLSFKDILQSETQKATATHRHQQSIVNKKVSSNFHWLFPILKHTPNLIEPFKNDSICFKNYRQAFQSMLDYLDLQVDTWKPIKISVIEAKRPYVSCNHWIGSESEHARIKHVLASLNSMGLTGPAKAFMDVLETIAPGRISEETRSEWRQAAGLPPLELKPVEPKSVERKPEKTIEQVQQTQLVKILHGGPLQALYRGEKYDGPAFTDLTKWSNKEIENDSRYFDLLFPNMERSMAEQFKADSTCMKNLEVAFQRALKFYGFAFVFANGKKTTVFLSGATYSWLTPNTPHLERITSILKFLNHVGLYEHAGAFIDSLEDLASTNTEIITKETLQNWQQYKAFHEHWDNVFLK